MGKGGHYRGGKVLARAEFFKENKSLERKGLIEMEGLLESKGQQKVGRGNYTGWG